MRRVRAMMTAVVAITALAACGVGGGEADVEAFPDQTIRMLFPFAAGSPGDLNARALANEAGGILGVDIEVVNRPGAAGTIGVTEALQADPDGYTLAFVPIATMTIQPQRTELAYAGPDDYETVMGATVLAEAISVPADSPHETLDDLLAATAAEPATVAISGQGTILDIDARMLAIEAGAQLEPVSFDGEQQLLAAMLGGTTDAAVSGVAAIAPFVEAGDARALAVFAEDRNETLPDVPTTTELGHDVTFGVNNFIIAPKGTDPAIVEKLHDSFLEAWETDAYQDFLDELGFTPQYMNSDDLRSFLEEEYEKYGVVVDELGL